MRLIDRLRALHPGASGRSIKTWLEQGRVRVDGDTARRGDAPIAPGARVELVGAERPFPSLLRLVYEDDDLLVIDKPAGLLSIATERERGRTAYRLLAEYTRQKSTRGHARLFVVHRLDRETSGLLVFAKSARIKRLLQEQFAARTVARRYVAVVEGVVREPSGVLSDRVVQDDALRVRVTRHPRLGQEAVTAYRVLERRRSATVLELTLTTGRRRQIRAQLAALGHPIVGDRAYGSRRDPLKRLCLHATHLGFLDRRRRRLTFDSPAPASFRGM